MNTKHCKNCNEKPSCDCVVKDLATKCIIYESTYLEALNIQRYTNLTDIIKTIDRVIKDLQNSSQPTPIVSVVNVGDGEGVFKTTDALRRLNFKSIVSDSPYIVTSSTEDTINLDFSEALLIDLITTMQPKSLNVEFSNNSVVQYFNETSTEKTLKFKDVIAGQNTTVTYNSDNIQVSARYPNITSSTLGIVQNGDNLTIDALDDGTPKIYVNSAYQGGNSNGTEARPFTSLTQAYGVYIGSGTIIAPQRLGTKIIVKKGNYLLPPTLLAKDIHIHLEDGAILYNTLISDTEYYFDFDSLPPEVSDFKVRVTGSGDCQFRYSRGVVKNSGYNQGVSNNTWLGRQFITEGVFYVRNATVNAVVFDLGEDSTPKHNNNLSTLSMNNCTINGASSATTFRFGNSKDIVISNSRINFSSADSNPFNIYPCIFSGIYVRFENCHFKGYQAHTNGMFYIKKGYTEASVENKLEFIGCIFEGNSPNVFTFEDETERPTLIIQRATSVFQTYGKLIKNLGTGKITTTQIVESYFTCPLGDADLTRGNTVSVINYFSGKLVESLIKSPNILTTTTQQEGTPYIYTNNNSTDVSTWKRTVVFS